MKDFEEYLRQGEPHKREKGYAWQTAIGLQAVDDLKPSEYLIETARQHIEGDITIEQAKDLIDSYYESKSVRNDIEDRTEEADKVSARIAEILSEKTFTFSPVEYINIHRRLFQGIYKFAGKIRDYNITKKEWVLKGETVLYASADSIRATLDFDFAQEKNFSYKDLNIQEAITHMARFISGIWQIHAFGEVDILSCLKARRFLDTDEDAYADAGLAPLSNSAMPCRRILFAARQSLSWTAPHTGQVQTLSDSFSSLLT